MAHLFSTSTFVYLWRLMAPVSEERGGRGSSALGSLAFIKCHYQYFRGAGWAETRLPLRRYPAMHMDASLIPLIHH